MKMLLNSAHIGRVGAYRIEHFLWPYAMTHEGERISIINIHQATSRQLDLQRRVNTHIQAEMNKSEGR